MKVVILAAGTGSRLGRNEPKALTELVNGRSILGQQLCMLAGAGIPRSAVTIVVGYKKDLIMEAVPDVSYAYNEMFDRTNTAKSLLKGLELTGDESVLWMNGDVVFDERLVELLTPHVEADASFVAVNRSPVGAEEVKYRRDQSNHITELSKHVDDAEGEAVGVNFVSRLDKPVLVEALRAAGDTDYFERGLELMIGRSDRPVAAVDVSESLCIEVDFEEDLLAVNELVSDLASS